MARGTPVARLSIEMVAEIARLQQDLDKAKKAVAAASGDISNQARAANDNLKAIGNGAGAGIKAFSRDVTALKASLDPAFAALQKYKSEVALLQKALSEGAITHKQFVEQMRVAVTTYKTHNGALATTGKSAGQVRSGMQQLSFQMNDVATQFAAGTPPMIIFAQQSGQVIQALSLMSNGTKGLLGFLGGPWGMVLTSALVVLSPFVAKLWESGDAAESSAKKVRSFATAADLAEQSTEVVKMTSSLGELQAQYDRMAGNTAPGRAFFANTVRGKELKAQIDAQRFEIEQTKAIIKLRSSRIDQIEREDKALKDAKASEIAHRKEMSAATKAAREAAKAQKDYEKSLIGRVESGTFIGQVMTELGKSRDEFMKSMTEGWAKEWQDAVKQAADYQTGSSDYAAKKQLDAGKKLLATGEEFAAVIGGGFGQALSRLLNALDQFKGFFQNLAGQLDQMFSKASGKFGEMFRNASAGAQVGAATADLMKSLGIKTSSTGAQIGGAIGSIGGPVGTIAGSIIGGVVGGLFKSVKKASATIEIAAGKAAVASISGNSAKLRAVAGQLADSLIGGLSSIADQLGGMLGNGVRVSIGQRKGTFRVDTSGMGRTKNMPAFETEAEAVAYALQAAIQQGAITGLRKGTETLIKAGGDLEAQLSKALAFEQVFKDLAAAANPAKAEMDAITKEFEGLIDIFAEAGASAEDYAQLQQLLAIRQREVLVEAFEPVAALLDELKANADSAGEAVKAAYQDVLSREADAVAAYADAVARQEEAARDAQRASIQSTIDSLRDGISTLQDQANGFAQAAERLRAFAETITVRSLGQLRQQFDRIAAAARRGNLDALNALPDAGQAYAEAASANATDAVSLAREMARIRAATQGAIGAADAGKSAADRQIAAMQRQIDLAQAQLDALNVSSEALVSVDEALANMQSAKAAADEARAQMALLSELTETQTSFSDAVKAYEAAKAARDDLLRQITAAGFADLLDTQKKSGSELIAAATAVAQMASTASTSAAAAIAQAQAAQAAQLAANDNIQSILAGLNIPYFASGGMHGGGLRIVGERGPEIEATGPARIWTAEQMAGALAGGDPALASEVRALREEMKRAMFQIANNTGKTADVLKQWDGDGQPETRSVA